MILPILMLVAGCAAEAPPASAEGPCEQATMWAALPDDIAETSGIAASRAHPGVLWTHNDSGNDAVLFAIDSTGAILARIPVRGATNRDWEDIALGPCGGPPGECLFIAEIGDNRERYPHVAVYRIREPDPRTDTITTPADRIRFTYPDGPRDAEALYVSDLGIHVIPKGRSHAIELFRLEPPFSTAQTAPLQSLQRLQRLAPPPTSVSAQVTAASITPDFATVVVRGYAGIRFFQPDGDTLLPLGTPATVAIPGMPQSEAIDFLDDGRLVLTGERSGGFPASMAVLRCQP